MTELVSSADCSYSDILLLIIDILFIDILFIDILFIDILFIDILFIDIHILYFVRQPVVTQ